MISCGKVRRINEFPFSFSIDDFLWEEDTKSSIVWNNQRLLSPSDDRKKKEEERRKKEERREKKEEKRKKKEERRKKEEKRKKTEKLFRLQSCTMYVPRLMKHLTILTLIVSYYLLPLFFENCVRGILALSGSLALATCQSCIHNSLCRNSRKCGSNRVIHSRSILPRI